jgi:hypothetical protein
MVEEYPPIPESVLNILKETWQLPEEEGVFVSAKKHRKNPSNKYEYVHHPGHGPSLDGYKYEEIKKLVADNVFGNRSRSDDSGTLFVNEDAQHALTDFCRETYGAWVKYRERVRAIA